MEIKKVALICGERVPKEDTLILNKIREIIKKKNIPSLEISITELSSKKIKSKNILINIKKRKKKRKKL